MNHDREFLELKFRALQCSMCTLSFPKIFWFKSTSDLSQMLQAGRLHLSISTPWQMV